jgi:hypothetical protein
MITRNLIIATVILLVISIIVGIILFFVPTEVRQAIRDVLISFFFLLTIFTMLMFLALTIAIFGLIEVLNNRVLPLLDQVTTMTTRVRGTTEFVSDEVVKPVITTAGTMARFRAMARAAVGKTPTAPVATVTSSPTPPTPPAPPASVTGPTP